MGALPTTYSLHVAQNPVTQQLTANVQTIIFITRKTSELIKLVFITYMPPLPGRASGL